MSLGTLAVRIVVGGFFIGHGTQKLFGWFGGGGRDVTADTMEKLDMEPALPNAVAAGATEAGCGAMIVAGLGTPLASAGLIATMLTAIRTVHWKNGPWNSNGGWEYNATVIATLVALTDNGPGRLSLDAALGQMRSGPRWALGALALGAVASTVVVEFGRRAAARKVTAQPAPHGQSASGAATSDTGAFDPSI